MMTQFPLHNIAMTRYDLGKPAQELAIFMHRANETTDTGSQPSYVIRISSMSPSSVLEPGGRLSGRLHSCISKDFSRGGLQTYMSTKLKTVQSFTG